MNEMKEFLGDGYLPPAPGPWKNLITNYYEEIGQQILEDGSEQLVVVYASKLADGIECFYELAGECKFIWDNNLRYLGTENFLN